MNKGEIYALTCAVLWASAVICFTKAGDRIDPFRLNLFKNLLVSLLIIPTVLLINGLNWPAFTQAQYITLIISGVLGITFADAFYFMTLNYLGAGRTAIMNCLYGPGALVFSIILLGERPTKNGLIGFTLILAGAVLASLVDQFEERSKRELRIGILCGVVTPLMIALSIVMIKPLMSHHAVLPVVATRVCTGTAIHILILLISGRLFISLKALAREPQPWGWMISGTLLGSFLANLAWTSGFKHAEAALAAVLNQTATIWIIVFATLFLKEKLTTKRIVGALLAFAGVWVITLK